MRELIKIAALSGVATIALATATAQARITRIEITKTEPAFAGQTFADGEEIENISVLATQKLNHRAKPWLWGRPPRPHRHLRRRFVYCL